MHLFIDGVVPGDLDTVVAVVVINAINDEETAASGVHLAGWVPLDGCDCDRDVVFDDRAIDTKGVVESAGAPIEGGAKGWPIVSSLDLVAGISGHFAWGSELAVVDDGPMAPRIATWMALIDAGARVLITRHGAEARRVAVLASDLLALEPASPTDRNTVVWP